MSHSSRNRPQNHRPDPASPGAFLQTSLDELTMAWRWAVAPLNRLFEAVIRDGIRPPTTFEGLPPGQFPPIDAFKDELFGRPDRGQRSAAAFETKVAPGVRISARADDRELP